MKYFRTVRNYLTTLTPSEPSAIYRHRNMWSRTLQRLLTIDDAAAQLGVTRGYLAQLRVSGKGPTFRAITPRTIRYAQEDIDVWLASAKRRSTSDKVPA